MKTVKRRVCKFALKSKVRLALVLLAFCFSLPAVSYAQTPQAAPPRLVPPREVQFPKPVERTLANGLRVIVIERAGTPVVTAQLVIKNGGEVDPPELAGLGNMLADLITKGTEKRSATPIAEEVEALGGSLYSSARWDSTRVGVDVMSSKISPAVDILADADQHHDLLQRAVARPLAEPVDRALDLAGFTKGDAKSTNTNERGYCPTGDRYIFEIVNGASDAQRYWSTSCRNSGTFKGNVAQVKQLFIAQIPPVDFAKETAGLHL